MVFLRYQYYTKRKLINNVYNNILGSNKMYLFFSDILDRDQEHEQYKGNENYSMRNHDRRLNPIFTKGGTPLVYSQNCERYRTKSNQIHI